MYEHVVFKFQVYLGMGFTQKELDDHFAGPAFLAWYEHQLYLTYFANVLLSGYIYLSHINYLSKSMYISKLVVILSVNSIPY